MKNKRYKGLSIKTVFDNAINTVEGESYLHEARNMAAYHHERWDESSS